MKAQLSIWAGLASVILLGFGGHFAEQWSRMCLVATQFQMLIFFVGSSIYKVPSVSARRLCNGKKTIIIHVSLNIIQ